jgi:glycosyltransferase involved in cell wall biosynthesis
MPIRSPRIDVLFLSWRDASHPEGGGSERYVHRMAEGMAATGLRVELFCAAHERATADELVNGVHVVRRGGRLGVYPRALLHLARRRPRLVVDVQNGLPFFSRLLTRSVVVLVHHVHREQWPIVFGRLGGAIGWWIESVLAPRLFRGRPYVTVSEATADELIGLGVDRGRLSIVPNGLEAPPPVVTGRSPHPSLVVLGRLVPHKRVEHALEVTARLRDRWPGLRLSVVGEGWWEEELRAEVGRLGLADVVDFHGYVDEQTKHELLAGAWVHLCPSVKEGWGLVVSEAGGHGVPTVGYRAAGGLRESVIDGVTGELVDDLEGMTAAVDRLLADRAAREAMGEAAARYAASLTWPASIDAFRSVLASALGRSAAVPVPEHVDGRVGTLLHDGLVRVDDGRGSGDHRDAENGTRGEGDERTRERLHSLTRFPGQRQRGGTVDGRNVIHNAEATTNPAARA